MPKHRVRLVYQPTPTVWSPGLKPGDVTEVTPEVAQRLLASGAWTRETPEPEPAAAPATTGRKQRGTKE